MTEQLQKAMDTTVVVETPNIVGVAAGNEDFNTLKAAVAKFRNIKQRRSHRFAPNNAASAKLPAGTVDTLLKPESLEKLEQF
jgi:uncharacterized surface protein with fasciclin (FAS1) repeats